MALGELIYSFHARQRMAQRGVTDEDVEYVYDHGQSFHRAGAEHHVLRRVDIPEEDASRVQRLDGTVVTLDSEAGVVLTVYRNAHAPKHLRRKPKWGWNKR